MIDHETIQDKRSAFEEDGDIDEETGNRRVMKLSRKE
jgi:hypothetical protein